MSSRFLFTCRRTHIQKDTKLSTLTSSKRVPTIHTTQKIIQHPRREILTDSTIFWFLLYPMNYLITKFFTINLKEYTFLSLIMLTAKYFTHSRLFIYVCKIFLHIVMKLRLTNFKYSIVFLIQFHYLFFNHFFEKIQLF